MNEGVARLTLLYGSLIKLIKCHFLKRGFVGGSVLYHGAHSCLPCSTHLEMWQIEGPLSPL